MLRRVRQVIHMTSMRMILSMSFAIMIVAAMLFVGFALQQEFEKTLVKSITDNSEEIMEQVKVNLDNYLYNMIDVSDLLIVKIPSNTDFDSTELDSIIDPMINTRRDVITIALFDDEGNHISSTSDSELQSSKRIIAQDWYQKIRYDSHWIYISEPHVQQIYKGEYPWVISISRRVGFKQGGEYREGILLIDMNFSVIEDLLAKVNLSDKGYVFLVNENNQLVYHKQQQLIYSGIKTENLEGIAEAYNGSYLQKNEERYIVTKPLNDVNWKLVGVYYTSDIESSQKRISDYIRGILIIGVVLFISFSMFMSSQISKPIQQLQKSMKVVEQGNFDEQLTVTGEHEVVQLANSYNVMIRRIKDLMNQIVHEQEEKRKSELSSLQAQINPHFLYNTLDSIIWMAEHEKHEDVIMMTSSLASLFRISISKGHMIIPVNKEIDHAKHYLTIQKMRYKDKFDFRFDIDEGVHQYEVLKLILQPIIENAIYHGIRHMVDEGFITIRAYLKDEDLYFEVEDDGLGMEEHLAKTVLFKDKDNETGVGLNNVHNRIRLMYGEGYGLTIESEIEEGTNITFRLPRNEVSS